MKQTARALVSFVNGFGVAIEKMAELAAGLQRMKNRRGFAQRNVGNLCSLGLLLHRLYSHQKMKVVLHQTIGIRIRHGYNIFDVKLQKIMVVPFFKKDVLPVNAPVVDVV